MECSFVNVEPIFGDGSAHHGGYCTPLAWRP
jgi:hypothetical protein